MATVRFSLQIEAGSLGDKYIRQELLEDALLPMSDLAGPSLSSSDSDSSLRVFVTGTGEEVGDWDPDRALPLRLASVGKTASLDSASIVLANLESTWTGELALSSQVDFLEYKYIVKRGNEVLLWETIPFNRTLPISSGNTAVTDGQFFLHSFP